MRKRNGNLGDENLSHGELLAALDAAGNLLSEPVQRSVAHATGVWHRSVSIFVLNQYGEVLIEKRSENKDLFPGYYDLVGGHLLVTQGPLEAACQEIYEELQLEVSAERLQQLSAIDGVIERVVLPEQAIVNLERKTIYLLELTPDEERDVLRLSAVLVQLSSDELAQRGTSGEVSHIEFWSWEQLVEVSRRAGHRPIASGTQSSMSDDDVRSKIETKCLALRSQCRRTFRHRYSFVSAGELSDADYDTALSCRFLDPPTSPASVVHLDAVFAAGQRQLDGAYQLGPFRRAVSGDERWDAKLHDPQTLYVRNLLSAFGYGLDPQERLVLDALSKDAEAFVGDLLNLPLSNGNRFRDDLGNLTDIAAARKAALVWLDNSAPESIRSELLSHPTCAVTVACLEAGFEVLERFMRLNTKAGFERFRRMSLVGLGASSADFNNPAFQALLKMRSTSVDGIAVFLEQGVADSLSPELGGDRFLREFFDTFVESGRPVRVAYLAGNSAQAHISLAIAQEILRINPRARISFMAKSGRPGSDLTLRDATAVLDSRRESVFSDLVHYRDEGRFVLEPDGPQCHGLDPSRISLNAARVLADSDVVLAEGQAYAEIRGWLKPTYIGFRVNGRVSEAIHGIPRESGASGFVRLTPGVSHFQDFETVIQRTVAVASNAPRTPAAAQTTAEYVQAILSENLELIVRSLFRGNYAEACRQLNAEARRLGKTFASVLLGAASAPPEPATVAQTMQGKHFPVFACGGGGGFSAVTLRALRMLGAPTVAGVPGTDDGGSTGELQRVLRGDRGHVFGVGDMAAILQDSIANRGKQALLAYRLDHEPRSLTVAVIERVVAEMASPTYRDSPIGEAADFLSFTCDQLNLARVIERRFCDDDGHSRLPLQGASLRNLNVIAAFELCGLLGDLTKPTDASRLAAWYVLQKALGISPDLLVLPVTFEDCVLYLKYELEISKETCERHQVPETCLGDSRQCLFGQQYIDKLPQPGRRVRAGVVRGPKDSRRPFANPEYLSRIRDAELFVMGAGSLVGSQLSQLAIQGVVDALLERADMRKILVLNHVKMDETIGMSLRDQVELIEATATANTSPDVLHRILGAGTSDGHLLRIGDLFTDIVVPRTIAREIEEAMTRMGLTTVREREENTAYIDFPQQGTTEGVNVYCNKYVKFLLEHPDFCRQHDVSVREVEVLSYLDQPSSLYNRRSEGGRYRGALFATTEDMSYLAERGIQRRRIHQVDCVGENWKFVKTEGAPTLEFFPGLVPEALLGIFRIALERSRVIRKPI